MTRQRGERNKKGNTTSRTATNANSASLVFPRLAMGVWGAAVMVERWCAYTNAFFLPYSSFNRLPGRSKTQCNVENRGSRGDECICMQFRSVLAMCNNCKTTHTHTHTHTVRITIGSFASRQRGSTSFFPHCSSLQPLQLQHRNYSSNACALTLFVPRVCPLKRLLLPVHS